MQLATSVAFWTPQHLRDVTGGRWLVEPADPACALTGIGTDSRELAPGQAFLALRGERFDGHAFITQAVERGAAMVIVEEGSAGQAMTSPALQVPDTLAALQRLASAYRDALAASGTKVIAVAGSNGKTTTRHLIHTVLSSKLRGTQSPRSFNNHIGVPLTLLAAREDDDFVVVEVGTNHPGEIAALGAIVRPDAAVITSVGHEHMEHFGTLEAVAEEEASILRFVRPGGLAVTPGPIQLDRDVLDSGSDYLEAAVGNEALPRGLHVSRFGSGAGCSTRVTSGNAPEEQPPLRFTVDGRLKVSLPLLGWHNIANALSAVAVGRWLGVPDESITEALAGVDPVPGRMQPMRLGAADGGIELIHDAYNANADSAKLAVETLAHWRALSPAPPRRVLVLGDMLELGERSADLHREVGRRIAGFDPSAEVAGAPLAARIDLAVFIGPLAQHAAEVLRWRWPPGHVHAFPAWSDDLPRRVAALLEPGDVVLLKASRGMRLERLIPAFEARFGAAASV